MKKIKRYNDYILEKYAADWTKHSDKTYYFRIENTKYFVKFTDTSGSVSVSFGVVVDENTPTEQWSFEDLDKSNAFKTMSTVSEIIKDFVTANPAVKKVIFFGRYDKENKVNNTPQWLLKLLASNAFTYLLADYINALLLRPSQWIKKPTQRTKMFSRWAERETKDIGWKVNRFGNEIQLVKESAI